jgi:hypothetical protein
MGSRGIWGGKRTRVGLCLGVVALTTAFAGPAFAADRYASPTGSGAEPCIQSAPCSLANAIQGHVAGQVHDGDHVLMLAGPYTSGTIITVDHAIDLGPAPGVSPPVINGSGLVGINVTSPGATVHDLSVVQAAGNVAIAGTGSWDRVYAKASSAALEACGPSNGAVVRDSVCSSDSFEGMFIPTPAGSVTVTLINDTIFESLSNEHGLIVGASAGKAATVNGSNLIVIGGHGAGGTDITVGSDGSMGANATVTLDHSAWSIQSVTGTGASLTPQGTAGNITAAPVLASVATGDFRELAGSPTIDAGFAVPNLGSLDLAGNPRIWPTCSGGSGGTPDIGAYEFTPALPACPPAPVTPAPVIPKKKCKKHRKHHAVAAKKCKKHKRK